jgi:Ala-tRNA(Pro) deacylase
MIFISDIYLTPLKDFTSSLQEITYETLDKLNISFERVQTSEIITMKDCSYINEKLNMNMVKSLFLCNRQQTKFYLFITTCTKIFSSKNFSRALNISRVSFSPENLMENILKTKIGATTIFSKLLDINNKLHIVIDKDVLAQEYYGCSDRTTTGYLKIKTSKIINEFLSFTRHIPSIVEV